MKTTIKILRVLTLMLALMLPRAGIGHAETLIVVTTNVDELNADGDCSLREAIEAVNTNADVDACFVGSLANSIIMSGGTYNLSMGDLDIKRDVTIIGTGP